MCDVCVISDDVSAQTLVPVRGRDGRGGVGPSLSRLASELNVLGDFEAKVLLSDDETVFADTLRSGAVFTTLPEKKQ